MLLRGLGKAHVGPGDVAVSRAAGGHRVHSLRPVMGAPCYLRGRKGDPYMGDPR